ncbi:MAG: hypothetical protein LBQ54_00755, partial [Planctomycetaceae bacterium]|nr:hypothetical protein [Planctomycetaceae bacterium]
MRKILFPHHRAGLSLIEILASVFILLIGILGVLSAVTLGGFQIRRVKIADQSAACGRAALAQIRMSDWQKEENIVDSTLADIVNYTNPYIVDPLGYFNLGTGSFDGSRSTLGTLDRFTLKTIKNTILYYRSQDSNLTFDQCYRSIAFRDFYWSDEIRFNVLDQQRTEIQMRDAEVSEQGGKVPAADENFSWMFMVTPQNDNNLCEVSAIVFYLRGNPADGER